MVCHGDYTVLDINSKFHLWGKWRDRPGFGDRKKKAPKWGLAVALLILNQLISAVPGRANIPVIEIGFSRLEKIAKPTAVDTFGSLIRETSRKKNNLLAADNVGVDFRFFHGGSQCVIGGRQADARIDDRGPIWLPHDFTIGDEPIDAVKRLLSVGITCGEYVRVIDSLYSWFPTSISIFNNDFKILIEDGSIIDLGIPRSHPCTLGSNKIFSCDFSIFGSSDGLLHGGLNQFSIGVDKLLSLFAGRFHFDQLTTERAPSEKGENYRQKHENKSGYINRTVFLVVAALLFGLSVLCVAKGLDFGGYLGGCIIMLGLPFMALSVCSFFYGFLNFSFP